VRELGFESLPVRFHVTPKFFFCNERTEAEWQGCSLPEHTMHGGGVGQGVLSSYGNQFSSAKTYHRHDVFDFDQSHACAGNAGDSAIQTVDARGKAVRV
jgi:hypothetical protein